MEINDLLSTNPELRTSNESELPQPTLDASDYFELLVTQLVNQDPLEPMKDTDFVAQMSSFTSLEQMKQLNEGFASFTDDQREISAHSYLGREVSVTHSSGLIVDGVVTAVSTVRDENDNPKTEITVDGQQYDLSAVREVRLAKEEAS